MLESKFKSKQREDFISRGWVFIQIGNEAPTGFPDTECIAPNGYHCYTEWKTTTKPKPLQKYWHQKLNEMGHDAFFVHPNNVNEWRQQMLRKGER